MSTTRAPRPAFSAAPVALVGVLVFFLAASYGCGNEQDFTAEMDTAGASLAQNIRLATVNQIALGNVVQGSYIVAFRSYSGASRRGFASFAAELRHQSVYLQETVGADPRVGEFRYITTLDLANPRLPDQQAVIQGPKELQLFWDETQVEENPATLAVVDFQSEAEARSALKEWDDAGKLLFAEPNGVSHLLEPSPFTKALADAYKAETIWWHSLIKLPQALDKLASSNVPANPTPVIAVLDSGVDIQNPALQGHIWQNPRPGESGCVDDVNGCDVTTARKNVLGTGFVAPYTTSGYGQSCGSTASGGSGGQDKGGDVGVCGHGTHVAGIIAANPGEKVGGVCPVCQIMPVKIIKTIEGKGSASDAAILTAFKYLTLFKSGQNVVRVANSSFGNYTRNRAVALLVSVLSKAPNELLVVGAAGNEQSMRRVYPAAYPEAIAVAAIQESKAKAPYSNFGPWVDVAAPGGSGAQGSSSQILSTVPGPDKFGTKQGTSMACPVVAGLAGLILAFDPGRGFQALRSSILNSADPALYDPEVGDGLNYTYYYTSIPGDAGRRPLLGSGIVDAVAALDNKTTTGIFGPNVKRVTGTCGVSGQPSSAAPRPSFPWLVLLLGWPLLPMICGYIGGLERKGPPP